MITDATALFDAALALRIASRGGASFLLFFSIALRPIFLVEFGGALC
jgi:hypothetical protein